MVITFAIIKDSYTDAAVSKMTSLIIAVVGVGITPVLAPIAGDFPQTVGSCWNGTTTCVLMVGGNLNSNAFAGLDASKTMYLVRRMTSWLRIPTDICCWYCFCLV